MYDPLYCYYRNGLQFHSAFLSGDDTESDTLFLHAKQSYMKCQELISTKLTSKLASYDYPVMGVGVALLALVNNFCDFYLEHLANRERNIMTLKIEVDARTVS